jgi:hypothetical protein
MAKAATQVTTEETTEETTKFSEAEIAAYDAEQQAAYAAQARERELFHAAVQAMNGLTAAGSDRGPKGIAQHAFAIADEMLAERERRAAK